MFLLSINKKNLVVAIIIGVISIIGDINLENQNNRAAAAICDNTTHALIGVFTWIGAFLNKKSPTDWSFAFEIFLCALFSSAIDVDHFIAAKSFKLKDATSLKTRPFMHCTTLVIFIVSTLLVFSYLLRITWLFKFGWILTAAFLSHHIRDSKRRGFWIWPFGHTMPVPWVLQLFLQMMFPYFLSVTIPRFTLSEVYRNEPVSRVETV